jgi:two-component system sensor histidine kinase KdpD
MFRKFERGERESAQLGVGLGLALCSTIVAAHGARITAAAAPGGGARFVMRFPLGEPPIMPTAEEPAKEGDT